MKRFILTLIVGLMSVIGLCAPKNSPWREIQIVEIPASTEISFGVTRSGNPKAWIALEGIGNVSVSPKSAEKFNNPKAWIALEGIGNVSVSPKSAEKFKAGQVKLELVKWYNDSTKKYRYSTRQVKGSVPTREEKNIDLSKVFR